MGRLVQYGSTYGPERGEQVGRISFDGIFPSSAEERAEDEIEGPGKDYIARCAVTVDPWLRYICLEGTLEILATFASGSCPDWYHVLSIYYDTTTTTTTTTFGVVK